MAHVQIVKSAQAQADEVDTMRRRIRALEAQLRDLGVEPTTEHMIAQASEAAPARDFTHGNTHVSIRPAAGAGAGPGVAAIAAATQAGPARKVAPQAKAQAQTQAQQPQAQTIGGKKVEIADDASVRMALLEID